MVNLQCDKEEGTCITQLQTFLGFFNCGQRTRLAAASGLRSLAGLRTRRFLCHDNQFDEAHRRPEDRP